MAIQNSIFAILLNGKQYHKQTGMFLSLFFFSSSISMIFSWNLQDNSRCQGRSQSSLKVKQHFFSQRSTHLSQEVIVLCHKQNALELL